LRAHRAAIAKVPLKGQVRAGGGVSELHGITHRGRAVAGEGGGGGFGGRYLHLITKDIAAHTVCGCQGGGVGHGRCIHMRRVLLHTYRAAITEVPFVGKAATSGGVSEFYWITQLDRAVAGEGGCR